MSNQIILWDTMITSLIKHKLICMLLWSFVQVVVLKIFLPWIETIKLLSKKKLFGRSLLKLSLLSIKFILIHKVLYFIVISNLKIYSLIRIIMLSWAILVCSEDWILKKSLPWLILQVLTTNLHNKLFLVYFQLKATSGPWAVSCLKWLL